MREKYEDDFDAGMGAEAVKKLLQQIDLEELVRARYDFDVVGHYARPDVFSLQVDRRAKSTVMFQD